MGVDSPGTSPERGQLVRAVALLEAVAVVGIEDMHPIDLAAEVLGQVEDLHNPDILPILVVVLPQGADPSREERSELQAD